jgi:hypothetical protein
VGKLLLIHPRKSSTSTTAGTIKEIGGGGGISNVVEDTTPELGGNLSAGGFTITNVKYAEFNDYIEINTAASGEAIRINDSNGAEIKWYDNAGTTSYGYIRGTSTGVDIQSESDIELNIGLATVVNATNSSFSVYQPTAIIGTTLLSVSRQMLFM